MGTFIRLSLVIVYIDATRKQTFQQKGEIHERNFNFKFQKL